MIDYMTLGLPMWTLFACLRTITWGAVADYDMKADMELCKLTKATALMKYCAKEREADWNGFAFNYPEFDYANAPNETKEDIKNKLALGTQSAQYRCIHAK